MKDGKLTPPADVVTAAGCRNRAMPTGGAVNAAVVPLLLLIGGAFHVAEAILAGCT